MKRNVFLGFYAIFTALLYIILFASCNADSEDPEWADYPHKLGTFNGLSASREWRIINDYCDFIRMTTGYYVHVHNYFLLGYYGTYNSAVVVMMNSPAVVTNIVFTYEIAGILFSHGGYPTPQVGKNGYFVGLELPEQGMGEGSGLREAYESGWLTPDDLKSIADRINM